MKKLIALVCIIGLFSSGCLYKYADTQYESAIPVGGYLTSGAISAIGAITVATSGYNNQKVAAGFGLLTLGLAVLLGSVSYQSFSEHKAWGHPLIETP